MRPKRHPSRVPHRAICMEPDSALIRAIDEWSRRLLRTSSITLVAPKIYHERFSELFQFKNEVLPSVYSTFKIKENNQNNLDLYDDKRLIGRIGSEVPSHDVVHVHTYSIGNILDIVDESIQKLIRAGYPGCVGCGGKDALEPWDEIASRERLSQ